MEKQNKDYSAFPAAWMPVGENSGLTKREYFAGLAMQGLLASESENFSQSSRDLAKYAVEISDALLERLRPQKPSEILQSLDDLKKA